MKKRLVEKQISLAILAVATLALFSALAAFNNILARNHRNGAREEMKIGREGAMRAVAERRKRAELVAGLIASESESAGEPLADLYGGDMERIGKLLLESGLNLAGIADIDGVVGRQYENIVGNGAIEVRRNEPIFLSPLFKKAIKGDVVSGVELCLPDSICVTAYAPLYSSEGEIAEYVRVAFVMDNRFASDVSRAMGADFLLLRKGRMIAGSIPAESLSDRDVETLYNSIQYFQESGAGETRWARIGGAQYAFNAAEIRDAGGRALGASVLGRNTERLEKSREESVRAMALLSLFSLMMSWAAGRFLARGIFGPLRALHEKALSIKSGDGYSRLETNRRDEIGELAGAFNDMSDAVEARECSLKQANEEIKINQDQIIRSGHLAAIGELAAGVAHEIGNPLSAISGYAQLISRSGGDIEKVKNFAAEIEKETEFIEKIIQDLLDFSRPSAGGRESVDISQLAESAIRTASAHKSFGRVEVANNVSPALPKAHCNRKEITQALLNLLVNAAQESPAGGKVTVDAAVVGGRIVVSVADEGPGVPADVAARMFDPFFTTKPGGVGTGLGLSICFRILEKHGGSIWHENMERGARFSFSLPINK